MSTIQANDISTQLAGWLQRQGQDYTEALRLLAHVQRQQSMNDNNAQRSLEKLQIVVDRIADIEKHIIPLRAQYHELGRPASPRLSEVLRNQQSLLEQFVEKIQSLHGGFEAERNRLMPQLDGNAKRRTMQNAYQRSMRTG